MLWWVLSTPLFLRLHERDIHVQCLSEATTTQPPDGVRIWESSNVSSNHADGALALRAVSTPPSHRRNIRMPVFGATASLRESLGMSSMSSASSGIPGPGYYSGKAIKCLGETSLDVLEYLIIRMRTFQYLYRLKRWETLNGKFGTKKQESFFGMLGDALEMSR
jgi:hypothetical protein